MDPQPLLGLQNGHEQVEELGDDVPPYSTYNEVRFFFSKGIPLGASALLEWGAPPMFAMVMAGHTEGSDALQSALGFARVFYNCTILMVMGGCIWGYMGAVLPGCIGAGRKDRIPYYLKRSLLLTGCIMLPFFLLQFWAGDIMHTFGVQASIAKEVDAYCSRMVIAALLLIWDLHLEIVFINLGYTRCAAFNSLVTGLGVDVVSTYLFIYHWDMGMRGVAIAQIIVRASRVLVWVLLMLWFGLTRAFFVHTSTEPLVTCKELVVFASLSAPSVVNNFAGWFVFELQVLCLANIKDIPPAAITAGAIWVQFESTLASIQTGWLQATQMRVLKLLGKQDVGARASFSLLSVLSAVLVCVTNVPLFCFPGQIATMVSNDSNVQWWFQRLVWVLMLHSQTRIVCISAGSLFIALGQWKVKLAITFVAFYVVAGPLAGWISLTDKVTRDVMTKLQVCVGATTLAQVLIAVAAFSYMFGLLDWKATAQLVHDRAMTDKQDDTDETEADTEDEADDTEGWSENSDLESMRYG